MRRLDIADTATTFPVPGGNSSSGSIDDTHGAITPGGCPERGEEVLCGTGLQRPSGPAPVTLRRGGTLTAPLEPLTARGRFSGDKSLWAKWLRIYHRQKEFLLPIPVLWAAHAAQMLSS